MDNTWVDVIGEARALRIAHAMGIDLWQADLENDEDWEDAVSVEETTEKPTPWKEGIQPEGSEPGMADTLRDALEPATKPCVVCGEPAPARGRYAGRCINHRGGVSPAKARKRKTKTEVATPEERLVVLARKVLVAQAQADAAASRRDAAVLELQDELVAIKEGKP